MDKQKTKIYSVANRKGGPGKTTYNMYLATRIYHLLYSKGLRVALFDLDDQRTAFNRRERESKSKPTMAKLKSMYPDDYKERLQSLYPVYSYTYEEYIKNYDKLIESFDVIFLDFPGRLEQGQVPVLKTITKVIVPVLADDDDIDSTITFMSTLGKMNVPCGWFINRYDGTKFHKYILNKGQDKFSKVHPNIVPLKWTDSPIEENRSTTIHINDAKEKARSTKSTVVPYDDENKTTSSMIKFLLKD